MKKSKILSPSNQHFYVLNSLAVSGCTFLMHTTIPYGIVVYMPDGTYCMTYILPSYQFYVIMKYLKDNFLLKK